MMTPNRDLLVLTGKITMNAKELEREVKFLNSLLLDVENVHVFCKVNEVIDLNKYRIISTPHIIMQTVRQKTLKPFVFVSNKN